jgi:hypothetical protein
VSTCLGTLTADHVESLFPLDTVNQDELGFSAPAGLVLNAKGRPDEKPLETMNVTAQMLKRTMSAFPKRTKT